MCCFGKGSDTHSPSIGERSLNLDEMLEEVVGEGGEEQVRISPRDEIGCGSMSVGSGDGMGWMQIVV